MFFGKYLKFNKNKKKSSQNYLPIFFFNTTFSNTVLQNMYLRTYLIFEIRKISRTPILFLVILPFYFSSSFYVNILIPRLQNYSFSIFYSFRDLVIAQTNCTNCELMQINFELTWNCFSQVSSHLPKCNKKRKNENGRSVSVIAFEGHCHLALADTINICICTYLHLCRHIAYGI